MEIKFTKVGNREWNTKCYVELSKDDLDLYDVYLKTKKVDGRLKGLVRGMYLDNNLGYKIIANSFKSSYTIIRRLVSKCLEPSELRVGTSVNTKHLSEMRSARLKLENPFSDVDFVRTSKGISGNFFYGTEKSYLRSTYEYIYIKWLIKNNIKFEYEPKTFKLSNGETYRPDFFVYFADGMKVIELKGHVYDLRIHKPKMLAEEYNLNVEIISNDEINKYTEIGYNRELSEWKKYLISTNQIVERKGIR